MLGWRVVAALGDFTSEFREPGDGSVESVSKAGDGRDRQSTHEKLPVRSEQNAD
jgi:hypothetical protein